MPGFGFGFSQTYTGDPHQIAIILENTKQFSAAVMAGDHTDIAEKYTKDAKFFPNSTLIIEGRKAIQSYWTSSGDSRTIYHKVTPSEIKIISNEAYDYGY